MGSREMEARTPLHPMQRRLRLLMVWTIAVYLAFACVAEGAMEDITEADAAQVFASERSSPAAEGDDDAFNEIEGFAMRAGATVLPGTEFAACENICLQEESCRSFSYRLHDKQCIWSTASLVFDPDFMFAAKTSDPTASKKYRKFEGMSYRTQGWTIIGGVDRAGCESMCTNAAGCKAYSSRARDNLCLLGPKGITYSQDFSYYEKAGIPYEPFPLLPPGGSYSCTGSLCPPPSDGDNAAPPATEDPKLEAMEGNVKSKLSKADHAMAKAESDEARSKAEVAKDKVATKESIQKLREKDETQLSDEEREIIQKDNQRLAQEEETLKLNFANEEIQEKMGQNGKSEAEMRESATKNAWTTEQRAQIAAERELKDGHRQTNLMMEQMAANNEEFQAVHRMMAAKEAQADAELASVKSKAQDDWIEEKEEKKLAKEHKELSSKSSAAGAANEVVQKLSAHRADMVGQESAEHVAKLSVEAKNKDAVNDQERAKKMSEKTAEMEKETKQEQAGIHAEMADLEKAGKEGGRQMTELEAKKYVTLSLAHEKAKEAAQEMKEKADNATRTMDLLKLKAQGHAENLQKLNEQELTRIKEKSDKKEITAKEVEQKDALKGAEISHKTAANATELAAKKEAQDNNLSDEEASKLIAQKLSEEKHFKEEQARIEAQGSAEYQTTSQQGQKMVDGSQQIADSSMHSATQEADKLEAEADAQAKLTERKSKKEAYEGIREVKKKTMEKLGIMEKVISSDVAAYVDSGDRTRQEEEDALTALNNAKSALEDADAVVQQNSEYAAAAAAQNAQDEASQATAQTLANNLAVVQAQTAAAQSANAAGQAAVDAAVSNAANANAVLDSVQEQGAEIVNNAATSNAQTVANNEAAATFAAGGSDLGEGLEEQAVQRPTDSAEEARRWAALSSATLLDITMGETADERLDNTYYRDDKADLKHLRPASYSRTFLGDVVSTKALDTEANATHPSPADSDEMTGKDTTKNNERAKKATDSSTEKSAKTTASEAQETYDQAVVNHNEAKSNIEVSENAPANTEYGAQADVEGELRVMNKDNWKMMSYIKFPQSILKDSDTVVEAVLRVYKFGGGAGPINIFAASCEWTRNDLTYTLSEVNPGGMALEDIKNDDTAEFPEGEKVWIDVKLSADKVQSARLQGDHICVRVSGGPSANYAVISSEMTDEKPELILYVSDGTPVEEGSATGPDSTLTDEEQKKIHARGIYRIQKTKEIRDQEATAEKQRIVTEQNAPEGAYTLLKKQRAVYANDVNYPTLYDEFAGLSQTTLEEDRDVKINNNLASLKDMEETRLQN